MTKLLATMVAVMALTLGIAPAWAHKSSDAYLQLTTTAAGTDLRWDIALRDLDAALDIDANADGRLTWGEVKGAWARIDAYALPRLAVQGCAFQLTRHGLEQRNDGTYAVLWLHSACQPERNVSVSYTLFADIDPTHRGITRIELPGEALQLRVLDPRRPSAVSSASSASGGATADGHAPSESASFLVEGMTHILGGYDHVLFLLCLLLPSVLRRTPNGWEPVDRLWQAVLPILGIVTAFTVAHSITLGLAALKLVSLPSSFIEPAIAVTIMVAAADNVLHLFGMHRAILTFLFGLVHGFGFAGVLSELDLPRGRFALALLEFNVGLEIGQIAIVVVAVGLLYVLRPWPGYRRWVVGGGSFAAGLIALLWFAERVSGSKWLPI